MKKIVKKIIIKITSPISLRTHPIYSMCLFRMIRFPLSRTLSRHFSAQAVSSLTATNLVSLRQREWDEKDQPETWLTRFQTGERLGIIKLDKKIFDYSPRLDLLQRVVVWQLARKRAGTAKVKTRGEVRGGGRKPLRQKGTGRARQGSIRAPHFRGGGVVHGPRGNKEYDYSLPKKVKSLGLCTALSVKYSQNDLIIVDDFTTKDHKTKTLLEVLALHDLKSVLFVEGGHFVNLPFVLAGKNIPQVDILPTIGINVVSILKREKLVLSLGALRMLEERLNAVLY